ncbi:uncharacterized protein SPPG_00054 [Spizellomyces punctatus DAOM BR117]|uniref:Ribosomal RNA-processing protein 14/surfeit locus protein 6 C-terminal domain-containing protein n=1 Tax=Spizellomyces punctatus (strain DAOM BR117) TaxID=645134 RepID=A0A0L0HTX7_SPIPD|nr:uncharacterized protein SPPG_00054 [Spizellomyces punctatus DAOM BR117]KND04324.1 hypothetical protein SPPG_00054 [Spizellomyces punctatus DAOM BR117]|eukprot:XP_016612363.1 hypothetical protein SPPG_00054 [Spizellomyces punctatus DAOM BR117]
MAVETATYSLEGLQERLAEHRKCFDSLVELIPAKYYLARDDDAPTGKYMHNKKNKAPKQVVKEATKKAKKAKLDPENVKSVLDIQTETLATSEAAQEDGGEPASADDVDHMEGLAPLPTGSIVELQEKLKSRIQELRTKRKAPTGTVDGEAPKSRQEILEKRAKRKRERKEGIKQKKEKRRKLDDTKGMAIDGPSKMDTKANGGSKAIKEDVTFGKLDFGIAEVAKKRKGPTDLTGQLKQAEAKKQKLEKLKQVDKEKAETIEEAAVWNKLLKQAEGEKVKDDLKLLKKSVKRKEKSKEKSATTWSNRQAQVKKEQEERQKKREENLKARQEARNAPKGSKGKKDKGKKPRPGFEGGVRKKGGKP